MPVFTALIIPCPSCGAQIIPNAIQGPGDPEYLVAKCRTCGELIEVRKDPVTRKMTAAVAKPA